MNNIAITVDVDTTEAVSALAELEAAINRVEAALNNLTVSMAPAAKKVSVDHLAKRDAGDLQLGFWTV